MYELTHKFGLEFDFSTQESQDPEHRNNIKKKIRKKDGVIYVEFSREHPDIVVIEYDPFITTPDDIYRKVQRLNGRIKRKVFL